MNSTNHKVGGYISHKASTILMQNSPSHGTPQL